jgi:hypothetical protein
LEVPPPKVQAMLLVQKLSEPASLVNVQHKVLPEPALVQSLAALQI